jgi:uncharacterized repeat protein (TIGR01451 family)
MVGRVRSLLILLTFVPVPVEAFAQTLSIADASFVEGTGAFGFMTMTVTLSPPSSQTVSVDYRTSSGTAISGTDFFESSGTLVFDPDVTSQEFTVTISGDQLDEADETFTVNLTAAINAGVSDPVAIGTILDDDLTPTISIANAGVTEADTTAQLNVALSAASGRTITVEFASADGTAIAPDDYLATSGVLTFAPGVVSQNIPVTIVGDTIDEDNEDFTVTLSNPSDVIIAQGTGIETIADDDGFSQISIADVSVSEATANAQVTVTLQPASLVLVTVDWATANGSASAGSDYTAGSGRLTFNPGVTQQTFTVPILNDTLDEANENFFVNLSNAVGAPINDPQGAVTIVDNDNPPNLTIADASITEGDGGSVALVFTLTLNVASGQTVGIDFDTAALTALAGSDFTAASGNVTFAPGIRTRTITIDVLGDLLDEDTEYLNVNLHNALNANVTRGQALGTILDNDPFPIVTIADTSVTEGDAGAVQAVFTVSLDRVSGREVRVGFQTVASSATAGSDYTSAAGAVSFPPGATSRTISINVLGDTADEPDETFFVDLTAVIAGTIGDNRAIGTILDDDLPPPYLALSVSNDVFVVGTQGTYTFHVENVGGPTTAPIALGDTLPDGLSYLSYSGSGWSCSENLGALDCTNPTLLDPNAALPDLLIDVDIGPAAYPSVTHTATASTFGSSDSALIETEVTGLADLMATMTGPSAPQSGTTVSWTITVTNLGPNAVSEMFIIDTLPATISEPTYTPSAGTYDPVSGLLSGLALAPNQSVQLTVGGLLACTASGTLLNSAMVSAGSGVIDPNGANDDPQFSSTIVECNRQCKTDTRRRCR